MYRIWWGAAEGKIVHVKLAVWELPSCQLMSSLPFSAVQYLYEQPQAADSQAADKDVGIQHTRNTCYFSLFDENFMHSVKEKHAL